MNQAITERLSALRSVMRREGVDYYMIPTADYHNSEYVADFFAERAYFSNFDGSAGTLLVGPEGAWLWADGRYWIQAEKQIGGTGIELMRMGEPGVPEISSFLVSMIKKDEVLGFDGRCISAAEGVLLERKLKKAGAHMRTDKDLGDEVWMDRPARPCSPVWCLDGETAGETAESKLNRLRKAMEDAGADYFVTSKLDEIMWLFNIRGGDVACNPVALSYAFVSGTEAFLFIQPDALTDKVREHAVRSGIILRPYDSFIAFIREFGFSGSVLTDPGMLSYEILRVLRESCAAGVIEKDSPVTQFKAVKNPVEIARSKEVYLEDSAAVCRFIFKLAREWDVTSMTEYDAAVRMDDLRRGISDFIELSFDTIAAYGPNAAMMHYEPTKEEAAPLKREGMLLVDCGGTYLRGTTDVTRTIALGPVTDEMKRDYTLTAAGNLALQNAVFMAGCTGRNLDILAREPLWAEGQDYKCGTGHGIGYILNVHEGPQNIRWRPTKGADTAALVPGMIVSDEPGVYKAGRHGIRIETILLVTEAFTTDDGEFYRFEPLTYAPFDRALIDPAFLTDKELRWLNEYHAACYEKIAPYMNESEREWLKEQTAPIK